MKEVICPNCDVTVDLDERIWCPKCGKAPDPGHAREVLRSITGGAFGVRNSTSPQIEAFWAGADADTVFGHGRSDAPPKFNKPKPKGETA